MKINYLNLSTMKKCASMGVVLLMTSFPALAENTYHRVERKDTLTKISTRYYGKSHYYDELALYNNISDPNFIRTGTILEIPPLKTLLTHQKENPMVLKPNYLQKLRVLCSEKYNNSEYCWLVAQINGIDDLSATYSDEEIFLPSLSNLSKYIELSKTIEPEDVLSNYYFVEKGDTLSKISYRKYGTYEYVDFLADINALKNKNLIRVGEALYVPGMYINHDSKVKRK